jgi:hypothetical protein
MPFLKKSINIKNFPTTVDILGATLTSAVVDVVVDISDADKATFYISGTLTEPSEINAIYTQIGKQ